MADAYTYNYRRPAIVDPYTVYMYTCTRPQIDLSTPAVPRQSVLLIITTILITVWHMVLYILLISRISSDCNVHLHILFCFFGMSYTMLSKLQMCLFQQYNTPCCNNIHFLRHFWPFTRIKTKQNWIYLTRNINYFRFQICIYYITSSNLVRLKFMFIVPTQ